MWHIGRSGVPIVGATWHVFFFFFGKAQLDIFETYCPPFDVGPRWDQVEAEVGSKSRSNGWLSFIFARCARDAETVWCKKTYRDQTATDTVDLLTTLRRTIQWPCWISWRLVVALIVPGPPTTPAPVNYNIPQAYFWASD